MRTQKAQGQATGASANQGDHSAGQQNGRVAGVFFLSALGAMYREQFRAPPTRGRHAVARGLGLERARDFFDVFFILVFGPPFLSAMVAQALGGLVSRRQQEVENASVFWVPYFPRVFCFSLLVHFCG